MTDEKLKLTRIAEESRGAIHDINDAIRNAKSAISTLERLKQDFEHLKAVAPHYEDPLNNIRESLWQFGDRDVVDIENRVRKLRNKYEVFHRLAYQRLNMNALTLEDVDKVLAAEFPSMQKLAGRNPNACCVIVRSVHGDILGVTRRGTTDKWGFPGGKVEPKEDPRAAAVRELYEETGAVVDPGHLREVYRDLDPDNNLCVTYLAEVWSGEPRQGDAGIVKWIPEDDFVTTLCAPNGPFSEYNRKVLEALASLDAERLYGRSP